MRSTAFFGRQFEVGPVLSSKDYRYRRPSRPVVNAVACLLSSDVDLTGPDARIPWRSKQAGFRQLRAVLRLAGGTWLVSDAADGAAGEWRVHELKIAATGWRTLDISRASVSRSRLRE